ncbi:MAG TPA: site-2 protease family protein, partial [Pyrinomonadaceae bacterium]|nr:site-2 protease family protein [Pyrinomonadaceae bacterium]
MNFLALFRRQIQVARVSGIPVRIDYRWFLVFALSAWVVATGFEQGSVMTQLVRLDAGAAWAAGVLTTVGLFLSIFGHELSHALAGRVEGIASEEIVLHPFGGLTRLSREPDNPRAEFRIAIAGPSSSFLFAVVSFALMYGARLAGYRAAAAGFSIVAYWNLFIAVSNLLPGYPLDGGRVLRAFLWKRYGRLDEATRTAALGGQLIAGTLVIFGVWFWWRLADPFRGLWMVLVGLFLWDAARSLTRTRSRKAQTVGDAMTAPVSVEPDSLVSHFVDNLLPLHRQEAVAVAQGGSLHGILTLKDLKQLPRERWHH